MEDNQITPDNSQYDKDVEIIKEFLNSEDIHLEDYSTYSVEYIDRPIEFTEVEVTTRIHEPHSIGVSQRHYVEDEGGVDVLQLIEAADTYKKTAYAELYEEGDPDFKVRTEKRTTGEGLRLYKISVDRSAKPLHETSVLRGDKYPYYHTIFVMVDEKDSDKPRVFHYLN
jgi:hypothetical protein